MNKSTSVLIDRLPEYKFNFLQFIIEAVLPILISAIFVYWLTTRLEKREKKRKEILELIDSIDITKSRCLSTAYRFKGLLRTFRLNKQNEPELSMYIPKLEWRNLDDLYWEYSARFSTFETILLRASTINIDSYTLGLIQEISDVFTEVEIIIERFMCSKGKHEEYINIDNVVQFKQDLDDAITDNDFKSKYSILLSNLILNSNNTFVVSKIKVKRFGS